MKDNMLDEFINPLKHAFRTRKGFSVLGKEFKDLKVFGKVINLDNEIPGIILDVFDNLGFITKDKRKPQIVAKKRTDYGWHLVINLPPGISFNKVKRFQEYFADAVKGFVVMKWNGALQMDIQTNTLPEKIFFRWDSTPYKKLALPVPIGYTQKGLEVFDLCDSPHMLVAGESGFGKSNFLHTTINALLPFARIFVIDPKKLDFGYLENHVVLAEEEDEIFNLLNALNGEHDKRVQKMKQARVIKIQQYKGGDMPLLVVVIDELAEIKNKNSLERINRILRLSRACGIHIIAGTQRPSVKVFGENGGDSRTLFASRLCFLVASEIDSRMVLGEENSMAAWLPVIKGRGIFKFGVDLKEVQTMFLNLDTEEDRQRAIKNHAERGWDIDTEKSMLPR